MPVSPPSGPTTPTTPTATSTFTIGDAATEMIPKVENRVSDLTLAYSWVRDALLEIAGNSDYKDEFDDLEIWGQSFNLTVGQQEYNFDLFLPLEADYNLSTLDVLIWTDYPTNNLRKQLTPTHYQDSDKFRQAQSIPAEWYRFSNLIGFNPLPNQPFLVQARILRRHPIIDTDLPSTPILLPREWWEVIEWAAAIRGFMYLLEYEKAGAIRTLLYGDPKYPTKPGLIEGIKKRRKRENWRQTIGLRPTLRGYGWGSS